MVRIVKNRKYLQNDECPISHMDLVNVIKTKSDFVIKLNCGHSFCYRAFIKAHIINNDVNNFSNCPYCLSKIKKVPVIINKYLSK